MSRTSAVAPISAPIATCAARSWRGVREVSSLPILAKLTPNVTNIAAVAQAVGGWRRRCHLGRQHMPGDGRRLAAAAAAVGQRHGRAQRSGDQADRATCRVPDCPGGDIPVVGIGGIATLDDVMEFLVAGASAVQIGTANFYNPRATMTILDGLSGCDRVAGGQQRVRATSSARSRPPSRHTQTDPQTTIRLLASTCAFSPAFNRPAAPTGATISARSANTSTCKTTTRRSTSSPTCTR